MENACFSRRKSYYYDPINSILMPEVQHSHKLDPISPPENIQWIKFQNDGENSLSILDKHRFNFPDLAA
jgi:hypothetical protein